MDEPKSPSLEELIADVLPKGYHFTIHHISSTPTSTEALYSAPPGESPEKTFLETHFLTVSAHIPSTTSSISTPPQSQGSSQPSSILIFAIEVLIYTTLHTTTLFVSKADSSGFLRLLSNIVSPLKPLTTTFLTYLLNTACRPGLQTTISLFARAQDQYLFARSIENKHKRVLDDRGLVKWWCRILDPVVNYPPPSFNHETPAKAYLTIPGLDNHETRSFLPNGTSSATLGQWVVGNPLKEITTFHDPPPRCLIPHFPDDPKSRFLDELDEELLGSQSLSHLSSSQRNSQASAGKVAKKGKKDNAKAGQWRSVKSLEQFWEMMAYRQECSAGRMVGFIWVVFPHSFDPPQRSREDLVRFAEKSQKKSAKKSRYGSKNSFRLHGPIMVRKPKVKVAADKEGGLKLSQKEYHRTHEMLLYQDFSTEIKAIDATKRWNRELAGMGIQGSEVVGKSEAKRTTTNGAAINVLGAGMVRKKRKTGERENGEVKNHLLSPRKKVRSEAPTEAKAEEPKVNVLGAGLVRKKNAA